MSNYLKKILVSFLILIMPYLNLTLKAMDLDEVKRSVSLYKGDTVNETNYKTALDDYNKIRLWIKSSREKPDTSTPNNSTTYNFSPTITLPAGIEISPGGVSRTKFDPRTQGDKVPKHIEYVCSYGDEEKFLRGTVIKLTATETKELIDIIETLNLKLKPKIDNYERHRGFNDWFTQGGHRSMKDWLKQDNHRKVSDWIEGEKSKGSKIWKKKK